MVELYNALKFITMLFFIQEILTFNLGVAFLKSVSTCILIHNPSLFILCKVFAPKHVHKLTLYDCQTCICVTD